MDLCNQTLPSDDWTSAHKFRKELEEAVRAAPDSEVEAVLHHDQGIDLVLTYGPALVEGRLTGLGDLGDRWDTTGEQIRLRRRPLGDRWIDDFNWQQNWHTQAGWLLKRLGVHWLSADLTVRELDPVPDPYTGFVTDLGAALDRLAPGLHLRVGAGDHTMVITPSDRLIHRRGRTEQGYNRQGPMPPWRDVQTAPRDYLVASLRDWVEWLAGPAGPEAVSVAVADGPTDYRATLPSFTVPFPTQKVGLKWDADPFGTLAGRGRPAVDLPSGWTDAAEALLARIVEAEDLSRPLPVEGPRQFALDLGDEELVVEAIDVDDQYISNQTVWPDSTPGRVAKKYPKYRRPEIVGQICTVLAGAGSDPDRVLAALRTSPPRPVSGDGAGGSEVDDLSGRLQANLPTD